MNGENDYLRRWARRKREAAKAPAAAAAPAVVASPAALPDVRALDFESDFGAFLRAQVDEGVRRAALKKLFTDPRFNVMDGLDIYIDDYSREDPIAPALLAQLEHARTTLFRPAPEEPVSQQPGTNEPPAASISTSDNNLREAGHDSETES